MKPALLLATLALTALWALGRVQRQRHRRAAWRRLAAFNGDEHLETWKEAS